MPLTTICTNPLKTPIKLILNKYNFENMSYKKDWKDYKEQLERYGYSEEEIAAVKEIREQGEHCEFEQFDFLFRQGIVKRTAKLRKPRNLFMYNDKFWYLNHRNKRYEYVGFFKEE